MSNEKDKKVKKTFIERLKEAADESGVLGASAMSPEDFQEVKDLAVSLASDGDLSSEDAEAVMAAVASKEGILDSRQQDELMKAIRKTARDAFDEGTSMKLKIFGAVSLVVSVVSLIVLISTVLGIVEGISQDAFASYSTVEVILKSLYIIVDIASCVLSTILGVRLLTGKRSRAATICYALVGTTVFIIFLETMIAGTQISLLWLIAELVLEIVLGTYLHPSLAHERQLEQNLLMRETEQRAETGTLGRELNTKDGYIKLDFFNLFWIFIIGCVLGLIVEIIWHMVVVEPGVYQDRAGLLYGPFSPIYGVGCVLMTMALNRFKTSNIIVIFVVCTVIGGCFEYFVSWWMETAFGMKAWDYSGKFLGDLLQGRTCLMFASMFGALGTAWIKLLLPITLRLINKFPWKYRYIVTAVCAVLMAANCVMTVQAFDCWFERMSGKPVVTDVQKFYAENYGNEYMANRFESITINPDTAARN